MINNETHSNSAKTTPPLSHSISPNYGCPIIHMMGLCVVAKIRDIVWMILRKGLEC